MFGFVIFVRMFFFFSLAFFKLKFVHCWVLLTHVCIALLGGCYRHGLSYIMFPSFILFIAGNQQKSYVYQCRKSKITICIRQNYAWKKPENEPHKVPWMKKKYGNKSNDITKYKYLSLVQMELFTITKDIHVSLGRGKVLARLKDIYCYYNKKQILLLLM